MGFVTNREKYLEHLKGRPVIDLPTPSLVANITAMDANLAKMNDFFAGPGCKLRPHFKSHKCVTLARRQMSQSNTVGITCAKLSEAEQLVLGGVHNILIANQVIGYDKAARIAEMNRNAAVHVTVDSKHGIEQLGSAARNAGVNIGVFIEIDIGMRRGGVQPGKPVLDLAEIISGTAGIRFVGIQSYEGHIITLEDYGERKRRVEQDLKPVIATKKRLEQKGIQIIVSSGGTGTYDITGNMEGIDELQCGSYVLMDAAYKKIRPEFENARCVLATVISDQKERITLDVGLKGMGAEYGTPEVLDFPGAVCLGFAEEHLMFRGIDASIGDKIRLIPPHGCTTNNLYDQMWITRNDIIEDLWPIEGRGCLE
jgi:D-serine deaminase-like pyridoxal phosphate-dependent protein